MEGTESDDSPTAKVSKQRPSVQETSTPVPVSVSPSNSRSSASSWRLNFRSERTCPTCNGTGRMPHGQDDELVALIPYSDKRLKPRRRCCVYLAIVLAVLIACGGILLAFMFPRSASIKLTAMNSSKAWIPYENFSDVSVPMQTQVHIHNDNFFPLEVQWLRIILYNINTRVGNSSDTAFSVRARADATAVVSQNATFTGSLAERVRTICTGKGWQHCLYMLAEAEMRYTILSQKAETVTSNYFFVSCDFIEESDWTDTNSCT